MDSRPRGRGLAACLLTLLLLAVADPLCGQEEARPELTGAVTLGGEPYAGAEVVLHRVSMTQAGEIDSVRADVEGRFRLRLPSVPREDEEGDVYFASVRHDGIVYFGRAVSRAIQLDSLYRVAAYDTLTAPEAGAPLPVAVRYVIAEEGPEAWRITDLFEIAHDGDRTWVAAADGGLTWRHPLPAGATDAQVGGGDVSPDAAVVRDGRLELSGPISPGQRQFVLRYEVPTLDGLVIPLEAGTRTVEILVREPAPELEVEGLPAVETVEMQPGVTFRRYAGDAPASGRVALSAGDPPARLPMEWLAVGLALLLAAAGLWAVRVGTAGSGGAPAPAVAGPEPVDPAVGIGGRDRILLEVARIDQRLEDGVSTEEGERLAARRAELVARLRSRA